MSDLQRLMGIDHGTKRIGIALSDPFGLFASPHNIIEHTNDKADLTEIKQVVKDEQVKLIIVGLPTGTDGGVGKQGAIVVRWARKLSQMVDVPIIMWDESNSTSRAQDIQQRGGKRKRHAEALDDIAAAAILQDYLHARETYGDKTGQPLETFADIP